MSVEESLGAQENRGRTRTYVYPCRSMQFIRSESLTNQPTNQPTVSPEPPADSLRIRSTHYNNEVS